MAAEVGGAVATITGFIAELASTISVGVGLIAESAAGLVGISADLAATIGVTVGDISASAVLWGAAGATENVIATAVTEPDGDLLSAAEDGFISGAIGGGIGGTFGRTLTIIRGNQIKIVIPGQVDKTMSLRSYQVTYLQSLHNLDADTIMLGKFGDGGPLSYIAKAGDTHEYFSLGGAWDSVKAAHNLTNDDMFRLFNKRFLQEGIDEGKTFLFSHYPKNDTGALHDEYKFIMQKENGYQFEKVPGGWIAHPK